MALSAASARRGAARSNGLAGPSSIAKSFGCDPVITSGTDTWRDLAVCSWRVTIDEFSLDPVSEICVNLNTGGPLGWSAGPAATGQCLPGQICVIAPETRTHFSTRDGTLLGTSLHLSTRRLRGLLGDEEGEQAARILRTRLGFDDPFVWAAAQALVDEVREPTERGSLYADATADAISLRLLRLATSDPDFGPRSRELSTQSLGNVREQIEANLDTGISLTELAAESGMSRHQFARAFFRTTGKSPHRYLTERRIERAKVLLRQTELSLVDVALSCGFSSQSHFCDQFRARTGTTPGRYRSGD